MKNIIILSCLLALLYSCKSKPTAPLSTPDSNNTTINLSDAQFKLAAIKSAPLKRQNIPTTLKLNGKVDVPPQNLVSVSVPMGGYLLSTSLLPGMRVNKGDVIAVMEDQQYIQLQQDYLQTQSKLNYAELEYNRQKELNQSQASSDKVTQQAQAEVALLRISLGALAQKLRLIHIDPMSLSPATISKSINIYSSIKGFVSKVNVNIGKYVTPADVLFELINPSDIHLNLKVYEKDVAKLAIGQKVTAYDNTHLDKRYKGEIILVSKDISPEGTADIHCHFDTYDENILPGMYMNAEVELIASLGSCVPEESVVTYEGKEYVYIETGRQQYELVPVATGTRAGGYVTIERPQQLINKNVVTQGAYTLLMKMKNKEE